jgi:hypothetical protein
VFAVRDVPNTTQRSRAELCEARTEARPPAGGVLDVATAQWGVATFLPAVIIVAAAVRRRVAVIARNTRTYRRTP